MNKVLCFFHFETKDKRICPWTVQIKEILRIRVVFIQGRQLHIVTRKKVEPKSHRVESKLDGFKFLEKFFVSPQFSDANGKDPNCGQYIHML